jgi:pimeloyl-ACP methyl ester carboxylesterase
MSWKELYPFASHRCKTPDGFSLHYVDEGQGEAVVMLHGNPTWSFMYRDLIRRVADAGQRALAADLIGCGLSDKPQDWSYHLEDHIRSIEHWLNDELQLKRVSLVLHDWGGAVGMGYATRHPERIERIVLMNTAAFLSDDCPRRIMLCRCPGLGAFLVRGLNGFVEAAIRMAPAKPLPAAVKAGYRAPYGNWHDRIATQRFVQDIPLKPSHPTWTTLQTIGEKLPLLAEKPILMCWGERDFCFHLGFLARWQELYPQAAVHTYPAASHYLLEDAGEEIFPVIEQFLRQPLRSGN